MKQKVFVTAWHPSAANITAPLVKRLVLEDRVLVGVLGTKYTKKVFDKINAPFLEEESSEPDYSVTSMREKIQNEKADLVICGASFQEMEKGEVDIPDQTAIVAARDLGIPSIRVHDYWRDMRKYTDKRTGDLEFVPDVVSVIDDYARSRLVSAGLPSDRIVVAGNPEADSLRSKIEKFNKSRRKEVREVVGLREDEVAFVYSGGVEWKREARNLGYWTLDNLTNLVDVMRYQRNPDIGVLVTLHPRMSDEDREEVADYLKKNNDYRIRVVDGFFDKGVDTEDLSLATEGVMTAFSTVGIKAAWMGRPVISLQPNLVRPVQFENGEVEFWTDNKDYLPVALDDKESKYLINKMLSDRGFRKRSVETARNSPVALGKGSEGVVELVYNLLP